MLTDNRFHMGALVFLLGLLVPCHQAQATSAIDQLEKMTGQNIDRFRPSRPAAPTKAPKSVAPNKSVKTSGHSATAPNPSAQIGAMLLQGIFSNILSSGDSREAEQERARQEELARQLENEKRIQRTAVIQQQRRTRDRESQQSLEAMRAAMSEPWDDAGDPRVVDLRGKKGIVSGIPVSETKPAVHTPLTPPPADHSPIRERLKRMALENEKVEQLMESLEQLESDLLHARRNAVELRHLSERNAREFEAIEVTVETATDNATQRGISMALGGLLSGSKATLKRLNLEVGHSSSAQGGILNHLNHVNDFVEFTEEAGKLKGDIDWIGAKRNLLKDLQYVGERLELVGGPYYEHGKSIVESSVDIYRELAAARRLRELEGSTSNYLAQQKSVGKQITHLVDRIQKTRTDILKTTGLKPEWKGAPKGSKATEIGSEVPHPFD